MIITEKDGAPRCKCRTPIKNLKWNKETGELSWSDDDGDSEFTGLKLTDSMKDLSNESDSRYTTTCFIK